MPAAPAHRFSKFLTIDQVAEILNVNKPTIYALLPNGQLGGLRLGGRGYLGQVFGSNRFLPGVPALRA